MQPGRDGRFGRYLRTNDKVWSPPSVIFIDCEAWRSERGHGEDQTLRLWCARQDDRRGQGAARPGTRRAHGQTAAQLAATVDQWCKGRETIWLYAHNLGYDLTVSALVENMGVFGWKVDRCSTAPEYLFLFMSNGRKRLTLTDSHHLLPMRLAAIGELMGIGKLRMPKQAAPDDEWFTYCGRDVDVLASAVLALMAHWDDYQLGAWSVSGAGCGWHAMRHMLPKGAITLIDDAQGAANDRAAIYGGRRYCWRHGPQLPGRYSEFDFTAAHATTAASYPMPVKRGPFFDQLDPYHRAIDGRLAVVIAECEIETDVPRFPCRMGGRVWYPVGRFRTVLASPEIAWARDLGCLRKIGRGQFHYTSTVLRPFFSRVLDTGRPDNDVWPPVVRAMWKQWGRSVVGKFAQRGYSVKQTRMLTDKIWHYERARDDKTGEEYWLIHYDGRIWEARVEGDGAQAYPAVLALVESYERVAIGKAAEMLGDSVIIQCDTDGLWADVAALERGEETGLGFRLADVDRRIRVQIALDVVNNQLGALQLREKHTVDRIAMWGPQNYDAGARSKHSGRPSGTREIRPGVWAGDTFPSVAFQMMRSASGVYRTESITWTRPACAVPGWVLAGGIVRPVQAAVDADGRQVVAPWRQTCWAARGDRLAAAQHAQLAGLYDAAQDCEREENSNGGIWDRTAEQARSAVSARRAAQRTAQTQANVPGVLASSGPGGGNVRASLADGGADKAY